MSTETEDLPARLVEFVGALRSKGIPAGPSETIDAGRVAETLGFDDRALLREGLAAALVRRGGQRQVFDMTFDLFFPAGVGAGTAVLTAEEEMGVEDIRDMLAMAAAEGDLRTLEQLAEVAVDFLGEVGDNDIQPGGWSAYQTLDRLQPQTTIAQAMQIRTGGGRGQQGGFTDRLERDEVRRSIEAFRLMVQSESRRRTAERRGRDIVTRHAVRQDSGQLEFLTANAEQLAELKAAVRPLSRKLATRLASRRRRANRGRIDVRRTIRRSISTGGVPIKPAWAHKAPHKPELVLLCDVSGSVAGFSSFTMLLVQALADQFSKVRVFAFVNAMAEVTELVKAGGDLDDRIRNEARVTKWHTSSDYGEAFQDFEEMYLAAIGPRSCVLILGDARNNNQALQLDSLHAIAERARRTFWLNPEHAMRWGLGDSAAPQYAEVVDMYECRNVDQLGLFVSRLLPV